MNNNSFQGFPIPEFRHAFFLQLPSNNLSKTDFIAFGFVPRSSFVTNLNGFGSFTSTPYRISKTIAKQDNGNKNFHLKNDIFCSE